MTKISQLSSIGDSLAIGDQFLIRDIDDTGSPNKSVTVSGITRALDLGTAAAPAIAFATDKNTGIFSPGADQLAISTNGTGRLFVDAAGNLLVGTNNNSGGLGERLSINGVGLVTQSAAGTNRGLFGTFGGSTQIVGAFDNIPLEFRTNNTERMRITSAGLVGIGTSSPNTALDVNGTINVRTNSFEFGRITTNNLSATFGGLNFQYNNSGTFTNGMVLDGGGRVGIGTTAPEQVLDVKGIIRTIGTNGWTTNGDTAFVHFGDAQNKIGGIRGGTIGFHANYAPLELSSGAGVGSASGEQLITFKTGTSERARIDSSGRLLVGTSTLLNHETRLTVAGPQDTGGTGVAHIRNTTSSGADDSPPLVVSKTMTTTSSSARFIQFYASNNSVGMGAIVGNGASNVQFATISDVRNKKNIHPLTNALKKIKALEVVSYDLKNSGEHIKAGFIAQNVETVFPEYVVENMANKDQEPRKGVTGGLSSGYVAVLTAALQEAVAKIESLEQRLTAAGID